MSNPNPKPGLGPGPAVSSTAPATGSTQPAPKLDKLPHEVRGPAQYPFQWQDYWLLIALGIVLITGLLGFWIFRLLKKRKSLAPAKPKGPPRKTVLLEKIKNSKPTLPFEREAQIRYFFELGFDLRELIEEVHDMPLTDLTLKELTPYLKQLPEFDSDIQNQMQQFFAKSDEIKFADQSIEWEKAKDWGELVKQWAKKVASYEPPPLEQDIQNHTQKQESN